MNEEDIGSVNIPDSATPAEAQLLATVAVLRVEISAVKAQLASAMADHEGRIRTLEARRSITPAMMWGALGGLVAVVATAAAVMQALEALH